MKSTIMALLKALACAVFVFAMVLTPPTAAHASSGMHDGLNDMPDHAHHADHDSVGQDGAVHSLNVMHDKNDLGSTTDDEHHASGQCCNGICISVVLGESGLVIAGQVKSGEYLSPHTQSRSVVPSGFLRPPQYLI